MAVSKGISLVFTGFSTGGAADGLALETLFHKKLLLALGKHKFTATVLADKRLVFHTFLPCECSFLDVPVFKGPPKAAFF